MRFLLATSLSLVAYVFGGYPLIMAALARLRPRPVRSDPAFTPPVSLVILAYNEADVIGERLENARALDYPAELLEVLVVADGSDDGTDEVARGFPGVRVEHRPERLGKLAAIERGIAAAGGDVLVLSDANNAYSADALRLLTAPFADPDVGVVTGRKVIDDGSGRPLDRAEGFYWRYESQLKTWETRAGSVAAVAGEILAVRREAYADPGANAIAEDFLQAMLAAADGWRVVYEPRALSVERASASTEDEAVRRSRLHAARFQSMRRLLPRLVRQDPRLAWQVVSHKGLRPLVPWALVGTAVSSAWLAPRSRWARVLAIAQVAFYGSAALGLEDERRGRKRLWTYLPYHFCRMNLAAFSGLRNLLRGRQTAVWTRVSRG